LIAKGANAASNDAAQVEQWWERWPDANIGIATGPSGLVVLDVDGPEGQAGLKALVEKHGPLPRTLVAKTGRAGGIHILLFTRLQGPAHHDRNDLLPGKTARME